MFPAEYNVDKASNQYWCCIQVIPSQHTVFGHHRSASETPFEWCFASRPIGARFKIYINWPLALHQRNDIQMEFRWWAHGGPRLLIGMIDLMFFPMLFVCWFGIAHAGCCLFIYYLCGINCQEFQHSYVSSEKVSALLSERVWLFTNNVFALFTKTCLRYLQKRRVCVIYKMHLCYLSQSMWFLFLRHMLNVTLLALCQLVSSADNLHK